MTRLWLQQVCFQKVWLCLLIVSVYFGLPCIPIVVATAAPNVVFLISDDQAWGDYSFMEHPAIETPTLDRLARESLTFTRGYVPTSLCRPSLATIVTGLYPHQHEIVGNDPRPQAGTKKNAAGKNPAYDALRERLIAKTDSLPTLPRMFANAGYASFQSGKWWEGSYDRGGFTAGMTRGFPYPGGRHGDAGLKIGREGLKPIFNFIEQTQAAQQPFFLWYAPFLPHTPHTPPQRLLEKYQQQTDSLPVAKYWAMCEWFDETCGTLLAYLDDHGLRENTLVVYVTDNGWINRTDASAYAPRSKRTPYEGGVRTPIMIRWPGHVAPQLDRHTLASSIDLVPTVLTACGKKVPPALPGINLLDEQARTQRQEIFGEVFTHDVADVDRPQASLLYRWVIRGPHKLILPNPTLLPDSKVELFDLSTDPNENQNLATKNGPLVQQLSADLESWWPISDK